jgi:hypothetical protein
MNESLNPMGIPCMSDWEKTAENDQGFVSKWKHDDTGALFAIMVMQRGHMLYVSPSNNGRFEPVAPVADSNLVVLITETIKSKLTGPICGGPEDPNVILAEKLGQKTRGCLGAGVIPKRNGEMGECFRCKTKGYVSTDDVARNRKWDDNNRAKQNTRVDMGDVSL